MKFKFKNVEYYIDGYLAMQLDSLIYNLKNDWDFILLISGDRMVRVGKSVFGMTVCAYLAYRIMQLKLHPDPYDVNSIYFDNERMMKEVYDKPKYCINHYDEGREGLAASKSMKQFQQDLLDFFAECGQLNQIFVIVLPDFFEMKEPIAVGRSEFLLNVYRKGINQKRDVFKTGTKIPVVKFDRGYFEFFSRKKKQILFDAAKSSKRKKYNLIPCNFYGRFTNQYPIDEVLYREKKLEALKRFKETAEKNKIDKSMQMKVHLAVKLKKEGKNSTEIAEHFEKYVGIRPGKSTIFQWIRNKAKYLEKSNSAGL